MNIIDIEENDSIPDHEDFHDFRFDVESEPFTLVPEPVLDGTKLTSKAMQMMSIVSTKDRSPKEISTRRKIALYAMLVLALLLGILVTAELVVNGQEKQGMRTLLTIAPGTSNIYLLNMFLDGKPLRWSHIDQMDVKILALEILESMRSIPFGDLSLELRGPVNESDAILEMACSRVDVRKSTAPLYCTETQKNEIRNLTTTTVSRCFHDTSSPLKNIVKCDGDEAGVEYLSHLLVRISYTSNLAFSTRCCDFDQTNFDVTQADSLRVCSAPTNGKLPFMKYYFL